MSIDTPTRDILVAPTAEELAPALDPEPDPELETAAEIRPLQVGIASMLSAAGAGWMSAALFNGSSAKLVALLGAVLGAGLVTVSHRTRRPAVIQYLSLPAILVFAALVVIPSLKAGESLPSVVKDAIRSGGLALAPIAFSPGWRFLLLVLTGLLSAAAASLASSLKQPKVATFLPVPAVFAISLLQPKSGAALNTGIGLGLIIASLGVSFGVELAREEATSSRFELRRLGRVVGMIAGLGILLVLIAQLGFLFPPAANNKIIPPQKPHLPPAVADSVLFTVNAPIATPVRVGVLDVYGIKQNAFLTPPYDKSRWLKIDPSSPLPQETEAISQNAGPATPSEKQINVTFTVGTLQGAVLPDVAAAVAIRSRSQLQYDPRTEIIETSAAPLLNETYEVMASSPPTGKQLEAVGHDVIPPALQEYLTAPAIPSSVAKVIAAAPKGDDFDRLSYLRTALYRKVIAQGPGVPSDIVGSQVADMLAGKHATPFQITAAEVLLARWAGIPARLGYGYFSTTQKSPGTYEIHPYDGASWVEAYFTGYGWIPLIGQPLHAQASLDQKKPNKLIQPSKNLGLVVFVPIQLHTFLQVYVLARFWALVALPFLIGLALAWIFWPVVVKLIRRFIRRRWAHKRGPAERIAVAYTEFRDRAADLRIGDSSLTPLGFRAEIEHDDEHSELAWLVTRVFWGDLRRDVRVDDALAAEQMLRSITRRLSNAQPASARVLAFASRSSLRAPFTREIPAWYPTPKPARQVRVALTRNSQRRLRGMKGRLRRWMPDPQIVTRRWLPVGLAAAAISGLFFALPSGHNARSAPTSLPATVAPASLRIGALDFVLRHELSAEQAFAKAGSASLVSQGQVYTLLAGGPRGPVQASLQVAAFRSGINAMSPGVRKGIFASIGGGIFQPVAATIGAQSWTVYQGTLPQQSIYVYFPPSGALYDLLVVQPGFSNATSAIAQIIKYQEMGTS